MRNVNEVSVEQKFLEVESVFLAHINTSLIGKIKPIYKITDLDSNQWFNIADLLLRYNIVLSHYAKQIGIEMAQKTMPLAAYMH